MKVLIIEDDGNKRQRIAEFVAAEFPELEILECSSYNSGFRTIVESKPELVLLDMSLPTFDSSTREPGGEMRPFAGREILRQLQRKGVSARVVVVTQLESFGEGADKKTLDEIRAELKARFLENYVETVFYQAAEVGWQEALKRALARALTK